MMTNAIEDVIAERRRQIETEGWTTEHDDSHVNGEMAGAAACYALASTFTGTLIIPPQNLWPWSGKWWKPGSPRRMLVKAGALILAEIERLDRAALASSRSSAGGKEE